MTAQSKWGKIVYAMAVLLWGGVLLYFYLHPQLDQYLAEKFHLYVLVGGLACWVLGIFNVWEACASEVDATCCGHAHEQGHHHGEIHPLVALLVVGLPMAYALEVTEHGVSDQRAAQLAAGAMSRDGFEDVEFPQFSLEELKRVKQQAEDGAYQMELMELFFSADDREMREVLEGQRVETVARLRDEPEHNENGKRMRIYRLYMRCCAADMSALPLLVEFERALPQWEANSWVIIAGTMSYVKIGEIDYPLLLVDRVEQTQAPAGAVRRF